MPYEFQQRRRVEFAETDMAGIVHFSNFFRYMESCEHAFVRSLGHSVHPGEQQHLRPDEPFGWARVRAECEYERPLRFEQEFAIHLLVRDKRSKSVVYDFVFSSLDEGAPGSLARGTLTVVCVSRVDGVLRAIAIPKALNELIEIAPASRAHEIAGMGDTPPAARVRP
jgi:YbgC/YbaW family acyl-CoA thioester hydrolase